MFLKIAYSVVVFFENFKSIQSYLPELQKKKNQNPK